MKEKNIRVRFAPSPTGIPHVGNIRTALFNYFFAKANDGIFILRLEDTDQARKVEGAEDAIKNSLKWLGIVWDEYVIQSERLSEYQKFAAQLVGKGMAKDEDGAVRFVVPREGVTSWVDKVGNKKIEFKNSEIEDFIILKKDGFPTYHFANVIDDHSSMISHIIRGEDWIPSTPKHILLYKALEWEIPEFVHVPNIFGPDGKKLSKRRGAKSVLDFKTDGILPEALLNYLMLLGWSPKDDREILTKDEIIKNFSLEKINVAPAIFDEKKLLWMNGMYIRQTQNSDLKIKILEFDSSLHDKIPNDLFMGFLEIAKTRIKTLKDFNNLVLPFFEERKKEGNILPILSKALGNLANWKSEAIGEEIKKVLNDNNMKFPNLYKILIGDDKGLPLGESFEILGKDKTLEFLK